MTKKYTDEYVSEAVTTFCGHFGNGIPEIHQRGAVVMTIAHMLSSEDYKITAATLLSSAVTIFRAMGMSPQSFENIMVETVEHYRRTEAERKTKVN